MDCDVQGDELTTPTPSNWRLTDGQLSAHHGSISAYWFLLRTAPAWRAASFLGGGWGCRDCGSVRRCQAALASWRARQHVRRGLRLKRATVLCQVQWNGCTRTYRIFGVDRRTCAKPLGRNVVIIFRLQFALLV